MAVATGRQRQQGTKVYILLSPDLSLSLAAKLITTLRNSVAGHDPVPSLLKGI